MLNYEESFIFLSLILIACDPVEWLTGHHSVWFLKNTTDIPLEIINFCSWDQDSFVVAPGDSTQIFAGGRYFGHNELPPFDDILQLDGIRVFDENGNKLCEWLSQNAAIDKRTIYTENEWRHYATTFEGPELLFIWTYDITEDDIRPDSSAISSDIVNP